MRTKFALAFYYLAIGFLTAVACVIVVKLIFWPPCTQVGNTCTIDPWSAAGLEATVLGVSATVLAILGAVAVAGWWTSLNHRVSDQVTALVTKFYDEQKEEITARLQELSKLFQPLDAQTKQLQTLEEQLIKENQEISKEYQELERYREAYLQGVEQFNAQRSHMDELKSRMEKLTEQLDLAVRASQKTLQKAKEKGKDIPEEDVKQSESS